jgi:hypothetical protein
MFAPSRETGVEIVLLKFSEEMKMKSITNAFVYQSALRSVFSAMLLLALLAGFLPTLSAQDQPEARNALERGYRTGYTDGYQSGWKDSVDGKPRDYRNKDEYARADRAYIAAYGELADYRDGYRQGFEIGYEAGYSRAGFNSNVPPNLQRRGDAAATGSVAVEHAPAPVSPAPAPTNSPSGAPLQIPSNTLWRVALLTRLASDISQPGDKFQARVVQPDLYAGAIITGRIESVKRAGKVTGSAQMQLSFQQITFPDGRASSFDAQVIDVAETNSNNVSRVDGEGGVRGRPTTKDSIAKIGGSTAIGATVGAIAGGGTGAAVGAAVGAGVGIGGVLVARGKDIRLEKGQEMTIRSIGETRIN